MRSPRHVPRRFRILALLCTVLLGFTLTAACTASGNAASTTTVNVLGPQNAVSQFAAAWQAAQAKQIGSQTSQPGNAAQQIDAVIQSLKPTRIAVSTDDLTQPTDGTAKVTAHFVWTIPGGISWAYDTSWNLTRDGGASSDNWTVTWSPTVINPKLGAQQSIKVAESSTTGGTLVDRDNNQLVSPVTVYSVLAFPGKVTDVAGTAKKLESLLKTFDPTVTAASVVAGIQKASKSVGYTVTNLRENEYDKVKAQLSALPGLTFPSQSRELPATKDFAKILLSEVTPVAQKMVTGTAGWKIVSTDSTGAELDTLEDHQPDAGSNVTITLDSTMQTAAEKVLASIKEPAVLVAIQPSTGEVLTVAQNQPANAQGPIALMGEYPPGSTFKIVTATAAFDANLVKPTTTVACPGVIDVNGQEIHNEGFELGDVPVTEAFAHSCNTTFAELATKLPADALTQAGYQYGVGRDFVIPGVTVLNGKIPTADGQSQKAENGFGQGTVLMTPFAAALMAATAANGQMPMPTVIRGTKTTIDQPAPARSQAVQTGIKTLMRAVVTDGTATILQSDGTVYAKTGTADFVNPQGKDQAHAWTVGFRGDVAFAALIVGGDDSKRTNVIIDNWLKAIGNK